MTSMSTVVQRYSKLLAAFPSPGGGGAHHALFKAGCLGFRAGLDAERVIVDVTANLPVGSRTVSEDEIRQGVEAGFAAAGGHVKPELYVRKVHPGLLERFIKKGHGATENDIQKRSPIALDWPEAEAAWRVLEALYGDGELLFVGDDGWGGRLGETIRPALEWQKVFQKAAAVRFPKIMVNPLTGRPVAKKSGVGETLRGDGCIFAFRFVVAEFDGLSINDQLAFWLAVPHLPVAALIHSGKKSIHAWLRVDCADVREWEREVEQKLFPGYLVPLGLDPACRNESRLSRMPGHRRADTGLMQRCLYLAPEGRAVGA